MSDTTHIPRGDSSEAQLVSAHRRTVALLPPPAETFEIRDARDEVGETLLYKLIEYDLIEQAGWASDDRLRHDWRTTEALWAILIRLGVVDEPGGAVSCGEGGLLPCGSSALRNVGGGTLVCQHCGERYDRAEVDA